MVRNWAEAHAIANIATAQAHYDLGVDTASPPIDVQQAVLEAGVTLMWRPLPRLFGIYINEPGRTPGILINSTLPRRAGRQTAAHELGHHRLGHGTRADKDLLVVLDLGDDPAASTSRHRGTSRWPAAEKMAEAFGSWFLMPRRAVLSGLARLGTDRPRSALDVYQLSLILGAPYRTIARHLPNLRLASRAAAQVWMAEAPGRLKAELDHGSVLRTSRAGEVWLLDERHNGATIPVQVGDRLVLAGVHQDLHRLDLPHGLLQVPRRPGANGGAHLVFESGPQFIGGTLAVLAGSGSPRDAGPDSWAVTVQLDTQPAGLAVGSKPRTQAHSQP